MKKTEEITIPRRITRLERTGVCETVEEELLLECKLNIFVDEQFWLSTLCTGTDLENLVVGRLFTAGKIQKIQEIKSCIFSNIAGQQRAKVILQKQKLPFCGDKEPNFYWEPEWIFKLADAFQEDTLLHRKTSCTHSCFLAQQDRVLYTAEDIGRHNAMDKVIGRALREQTALEQSILYTSGRIPVDMLQKVIRAGVPLVISNATPTEDAVALAQAHGITLIGGVRKAHMKLYTDFRK